VKRYTSMVYICPTEERSKQNVNHANKWCTACHNVQLFISAWSAVWKPITCSVQSTVQC